MAGDWIKMQKSLLTSGKVVRMMSALNADRLRTIGGLFAAWCLFDEQTEDGSLEGYTAEIFDETIGFAGLAKAMQSVGWLEVGRNGLKAMNFGEHNGTTAKRRAQESVRKMSARNADKTRTDCALEKRREEKRREEEKEGGGGEVVMTFPVKGGASWGLTKDVANELKARFGKKDRKTEYEKAVDWLESDNKNLKTPQGMKRFLATWLERSEDKQPVERMRTSADLLEETRLAMESRQKRYDAERLAREQAEQQSKEGG